MFDLPSSSLLVLLPLDDDFLCRWRTVLADIDTFQQQMIAGSDSRNHGEAKNSWLTGTASANFLGVSQYLLGVMPDWNGLRIDPCVPKSWKQFKVHRQYRGETYEITIDNPDGVSKGIKEISVDGKTFQDNLIPVFGDGKKHEIHVLMG